MKQEEARAQVIRYWLDKADRALASARLEHAQGNHDFAMNRAYYACFYVVSALLLKEGRKFARHSGVRDALHAQLVKSG